MSFRIDGKYNSAIVFSNGKDEKAIGQITDLLNQDFVKGADIRIMPDYHYGAGCTIGFTANLGDKVIPNLVGVDLGCGMLVIMLEKNYFPLEKLDEIIHTRIPAGKNSHENKKFSFDKINELYCLRDLAHIGVFEKQIGTLGGGNHFLEVDMDNEENYYLVIHSGSRNMGKQVADFYQNLAIESCKGLGDLQVEKLKLIASLKEEGKKDLIESELKRLEEKFKNEQPKYPRDLCFLTGETKDRYLHDMKICQEYAVENREGMAEIIIQNMFDNKILDDFDYFHTVHNYIDFEDKIIRKGAVSAYYGERLIIPINMRDGSLLCTGKGNRMWNFSAPHGAGRLMGRNEAKRMLNMGDFKDSMKDIFSTTVNESTLDEAPMAYKPMREIIENIEGTVEVDKIIRPVYNFKASE